jgi:hypothetical protein
VPTEVPLHSVISVGNTGPHIVERAVRKGEKGYINNEKSFRTVWTELAQEFPEVFNHCVEQTLWNAARDSEMQLPLTRAETICR